MKLNIVWSSGDREVALKLVFMYTLNAKLREWWDDIELIVWGPSAKLLVEDAEIQNYMKKIQEAGVVVTACIACAKTYGAVEQIRDMGIDIKGMGVPLTNMLKNNERVVTF